MKSLVLILSLNLILPLLAQAEYRVFLLKITQTATDSSQPPVFRLIESNLDPEQYSKYYPVYPNEKISYIDTWRCYGRTDSYQEFCKSPRAPAVSPDEDPTEDQISKPIR